MVNWAARVVNDKIVRRECRVKNTPKVGCAGALLVHPVLFFLGFAKGVVFGHPQPRVMSPTSAYGNVEAGLAGGVNVLEDIVIHYVMTLGIAFVFVSLAGAVLAYSLTCVVSRFKSSRM